MNDKEFAAAKKLFDIPDVKKGSYSFIGDSNICYADIKTLFDYIKCLEQENKEYKEVINKLRELIGKHYFKQSDDYYDYFTEGVCLQDGDYQELEDILKEVE